MTDAVHTYTTRIYYDDTDASGFVYHSNYLKMAERARSTMLYDQGVDHRTLKSAEDAGFVVRHAEIDYKQPARLDDIVKIQTKVLELKGASVKVLQEIWKDDQLLVSLTLKLAVINSLGRPVRLPETIQRALKP